MGVVRHGAALRHPDESERESFTMVLFLSLFVIIQSLSGLIGVVIECPGIPVSFCFYFICYAIKLNYNHYNVLAYVTLLNTDLRLDVVISAFNKIWLTVMMFYETTVHT